MPFAAATVKNLADGILQVRRLAVFRVGELKLETFGGADGGEVVLPGVAERSWVPITPFASAALAVVPRLGEYYFQTGRVAEKPVQERWDPSICLVMKLAGVNHESAYETVEKVVVGSLRMTPLPEVPVGDEDVLEGLEGYDFRSRG